MTTSPPLYAIDTETTGLDPFVEEVFEIAVVDIRTGVERVFRLEPRPETVARMHPKAVEVNRFHERTSDPAWRWDDPGEVLQALTNLEGATFVGAVPDFDARFLTHLYRAWGMQPPRWHYHLIDVENLCLGWLLGRDLIRELALPVDSEELSRMVGVEPPGGDDRHTALADARWVRDMFLAVAPAGVAE